MADSNSNTGWTAVRQAKEQLLILAGALTGLAVLAFVLHVNSGGQKTLIEPKEKTSTQSPPPTPVKPIDLGAVRRRAWEKTVPHLLDEAEAAGGEEVDNCLKDVSAFLERQKKGIPRF